MLLEGRILVFLIFTFQLLLIRTSILKWTKHLGSNNNDEAYSNIVDSSGKYIYETGYTLASLNGNNNTGNGVCFLVKYDSEGYQYWIRQFGASIFDRATSVTIDGTGEFIYVTGYTYSSSRNYDCFLMKFNSEGTLQWRILFGSNGVDKAQSITIDGSGKFIYVTGYTNGSIEENVNARVYDGFVVKFDSDGKQQWARQFGTSGNEETTSITIDSPGNFLYITGYTYGSFDKYSNAGELDAFIVKFDSEGKLIWTRQFGSSKSDQARSVILDPTAKYIYVTGFTNGSQDGYTNSGDNDIFVVKFHSEGYQIWNRQIGSNKDDQAYSVTMDRTGNFFYLTGYTYGNLDGNINAGSYDCFLMKYHSDGTRIWTKQFGTNIYDYAQSVGIDAIGNFIYVTGYTGGNLDGNANAGGTDIFLVKYEEPMCKESCYMCDPTSVEKCTSCVSGYFKKAELSFPTECFSSNSPPQGYFLENTEFSKCHESCNSCSLKNTDCTSCASGYFKKADLSFPTECFSSSSAPQGYFLDKSAFSKCHQSCNSCISKTTTCTSCAAGFFKKAQSSFPTECFNTDTTTPTTPTTPTAPTNPTGPTSPTNSQSQPPQDNTPTLIKCDESCSSCTSQSSTCISCSSGYFKKFDFNFPTQCFNKNYTPPQGYFLDNSSFSKCNESCADCKYASTCTSCATGYYKKAEMNFPTECYKQNSPPIGYFYSLEKNNFQRCFESCGSCTSQGPQCSSCSFGYFRKEESNFPSECFSYYSQPQGYYLNQTFFSKCHENCKNCFGPLAENCSEKISCIENCLLCRTNNICEKCRDGFKHNQVKNTCEFLDTDFCKTKNINGICTECLLGRSLENNKCICKGFIDQSFCCPQIEYCSQENTKYIKEIDSCGCKECEENKFLFNYKCISQEIPNNNCFIFQKESRTFIPINSYDCIENLLNFKIVYHQFCLREKYITKFPLEYRNIRLFIFSMSDKGVYQYLKHSSAQEALLELECNENIHSYFYLALKCDVPYQENWIVDVKKSKFFITNRNEKIKKPGETSFSLITHDLFEDSMEEYSEVCNKEVKFFDGYERENLKNLCFSLKSNMVDLENNLCSSHSYCSKESEDLFTTVSNEKCFKCAPGGFIYDAKKQKCFTYALSDKNLRERLSLILLIFFLTIAIIGYPILAYLFLIKFRSDEKFKKKIKELCIICYAVIDLVIDLRFILGSSFSTLRLKYASFICFLLQPAVLFIFYLFLTLFKRSEKKRCRSWYMRLLIALPISLLFTIMSLIQLIGKSFEIVNNTVSHLIKVGIDLNLWTKFADLILETIPQLVLKIIVLSSSKDFSFWNIISLLFSFIGLIYTIFILTVSWVPEQHTKEHEENDKRKETNNNNEKQKVEYNPVQINNIDEKEINRIKNDDIIQTDNGGNIVITLQNSNLNNDVRV